MNVEQFRNIIAGAQETPSTHCWDAIQQQLVSSTAAVAASQSAGQTIEKVTSTAWKGAASVAKIAAIATGFMAATSIVVIAILHLTSAKETSSLSPSVSEISLVSDTIETTNTTVYNDTTISPITGTKITHSQTNICNEANPNNTTLPSSPLKETTNIQNNIPENSASNPSTSNSSASSHSSNVISVAKQTVTTLEEDPVAIQYHQEENPDYRPPVRIEIPNTITPNGDNYNDFFIITGLEQCDEYQLIIFNQARKEIFRTKNYQNNWDASYQTGNIFYYTLIYKVNNIQEKRSGTIYVLR